MDISCNSVAKPPGDGPRRRRDQQGSLPRKHRIQTSVFQNEATRLFTLPEMLASACNKQFSADSRGSHYIRLTCAMPDVKRAQKAGRAIAPDFLTTEATEDTKNWLRNSRFLCALSKTKKEMQILLKQRSVGATYHVARNHKSRRQRATRLVAPTRLVRY